MTTTQSSHNTRELPKLDVVEKLIRDFNQQVEREPKVPHDSAINIQKFITHFRACANLIGHDVDSTQGKTLDLPRSPNEHLWQHIAINLDHVCCALIAKHTNDVFYLSSKDGYARKINLSDLES